LKSAVDVRGIVNKNNRERELEMRFKVVIERKAFNCTWKWFIYEMIVDGGK
jgi:hypothetical protein